MMAPRDSYDKQCKNCRYTKKYSLPKIRKRVVYLDQFVIDNIVKLLDTKHPKHEAVIRDGFWFEVFKRLDMLVRAQLIVCPDSFFHRDEAGPTGYFESVQRIYEHFSGGNTFDPSTEIAKKQVCEHFQNYLQGKPDILPGTDPEKIVHGHLHEWNGRIQISINMKPRSEDVTSSNKLRPKRTQSS